MPPTGPAAARDAYEIREGVRDRIGDIRTCVQQESIEDPNLRGRVTVRFVIADTGEVRSAETFDSELPERSRDLEDCVLAAVRRWSFPARPGVPPADVVYPFVLSVARPVASTSGLIAGKRRVGQWFALPRTQGGTAIIEVQSGREHGPAAGVVVELTIEDRRGLERLRTVTNDDGWAIFAGLPRGATIRGSLASDAMAVSESAAVGADGLGTILVDENTRLGSP